MVEGMNRKPDFKPVAPNIDTLENCAVRLERCGGAWPGA